MTEEIVNKHIILECVYEKTQVHVFLISTDGKNVYHKKQPVYFYACVGVF